MKSDIRDYTVVLIRESAAAILVYDGSVEAWLARSQIEVEDTGKKDERLRKVLVVSVPNWLAREKGLA